MRLDDERSTVGSEVGLEQINDLKRKVRSLESEIRDLKTKTQNESLNSQTKGSKKSPLHAPAEVSALANFNWTDEHVATAAWQALKDAGYEVGDALVLVKKRKRQTAATPAASEDSRQHAITDVVVRTNPTTKEGEPTSLDVVSPLCSSPLKSHTHGQEGAQHPRQLVSTFDRAQDHQHDVQFNWQEFKHAVVQTSQPATTSTSWETELRDKPCITDELQKWALGFSSAKDYLPILDGKMSLICNEAAECQAFIQRYLSAAKSAVPSAADINEILVKLLGYLAKATRRLKHRLETKPYGRIISKGDARQPYLHLSKMRQFLQLLLQAWKTELQGLDSPSTASTMIDYMDVYMCGLLVICQHAIDSSKFDKNTATATDLQDDTSRLLTSLDVRDSDCDSVSSSDSDIGTNPLKAWVAQSVASEEVGEEKTVEGGNMEEQYDDDDDAVFQNDDADDPSGCNDDDTTAGLSQASGKISRTGSNAGVITKKVQAFLNHTGKARDIKRDFNRFHAARKSWCAAGIYGPSINHRNQVGLDDAFIYKNMVDAHHGKLKNKSLDKPLRNSEKAFDLYMKLFPERVRKSLGSEELYVAKVEDAEKKDSSEENAGKLEPITEATEEPSPKSAVPISERKRAAVQEPPKSDVPPPKQVDPIKPASATETQRKQPPLTPLPRQELPSQQSDKKEAAKASTAKTPRNQPPPTPTVNSTPRNQPPPTPTVHSEIRKKLAEQYGFTKSVSLKNSAQLATPRASQQGAKKRPRDSDDTGTLEHSAQKSTSSKRQQSRGMVDFSQSSVTKNQKKVRLAAIT